MRRPGRERSYRQLSKDQVGEPAAPDQRNLGSTVSMADIVAEVENDHQESVMKLAQANKVLAKMVQDLQLSRSQLGAQSNCFITVGESAEGQRASWTGSASIKRPPRRSWRGYQKWHDGELC
jgi:hypothetical protein